MYLKYTSNKQWSQRGAHSLPTNRPNKTRRPKCSVTPPSDDLSTFPEYGPAGRLSWSYPLKQYDIQEHLPVAASNISLTKNYIK